MFNRARGCRGMISIPAVPGLLETLHHLVRQIPAGSVATFGDLAAGLGDPIAARWVGIVAAESIPSHEMPWHRIVRVDGSFSPLPEPVARLRAQWLAEEGVEIRRGKVDLARHGFRFFYSERPLATLRSFQFYLADRVRRSPRKHLPEFVAGVDVAYPDAAWGQAAYALVETASGRLVWSHTIRRPVTFPYITSFLSFRELPLLLPLLDAVQAEGKLTTVVMVDGSGVLHPTGAGIASHLGVIASVPTIGVTKKPLHGQVGIEDMKPGESRPVLVNGRPSGVALRPESGTRRPIFVSPGHRVDLAYAERLTRMLMFGRRLPAPVYWADRLSRE